RFKHVLIREVAYSGLSKSARADLHERFARWLHARAGEELLEIRAYHLDQAAALITELDGGPPPELAREAAAALETAGRRSLARDVADGNDYEPRFDALHVLNTGAWWRGRLTDSERYARDQLALAQEAGREDLESRAAIDLAGVHNARTEYDLAAPLFARALELAEQSGSIVARGHALASAGDFAIYRDHY